MLYIFTHYFCDWCILKHKHNSKCSFYHGLWVILVCFQLMMKWCCLDTHQLVVLLFLEIKPIKYLIASILPYTYHLYMSSSCPPSLQLGPLPHQVHREHQPEDLPRVQLGLRPGLGGNHLFLRRRNPLLSQPQELRGVLLTRIQAEDPAVTRYSGVKERVLGVFSFNGSIPKNFEEYCTPDLSQ